MDYINEAKLRKNTIIKNIQEAVSIPSVLDTTTASENAPFGKEIRRALDWMLEKGRADGFKVIDVDGYAGAIIYGEHESSISMLGHLDVVPAGVGWTRDPFGGEIEDGYIFGRGVGDDKGPTLAAYEAMKMVRDSGQPLSKNLMLIVGCDEESGMSCIEYFLEHGPKTDLGFVPDAEFPVVYGEKNIAIVEIESHDKTCLRSFDGGERANVVIGLATAHVEGELKQELFDFFLTAQNLTGSCRVDNGYAYYTINGKNAHGSLPDLGVNAAVALLSFIGGAYQDTVALEAYKLFHDYYGKGIGIKFHGAYMGHLTMNLGIVTYKDGVFHATIDIRYPNDYTEKELITNIKRSLENANGSFEIESYTNSEGLFADPNGFLVKSLMESYQQVTQDYQTPPMTMGGGTYARHIPNHVAFGMEFLTRPSKEGVGSFHELDEGVAIDNIIDATAIYAYALEKLAK